jgi:hypothetical protein
LLVFMKSKGFVPFFTIPVNADVIAGKFAKKSKTVPRLLPQTHDHKVFYYKFLLKLLDYVCISTFININLIQLSRFRRTNLQRVGIFLENP